jgi:hypothetical protein
MISKDRPTCGPHPPGTHRRGKVVDEPSVARASRSVVTTITQCRGCRSSQLRRFLDLGETPLADALVTDEVVANPALEPRYPLAVAFCEECALVQITEDVEPEVLFVDNYLYFSSYSDQLLRTVATTPSGSSSRDV